MNNVISGSPFKLKSSTKYSTDVVLSSGEESLQEFIFADGSDDSGRMVVKGGTIVRYLHTILIFEAIRLIQNLNVVNFQIKHVSLKVALHS